MSTTSIDPFVLVLNCQKIYIATLGRDPPGSGNYYVRHWPVGHRAYGCKLRAFFGRRLVSYTVILTVSAWYLSYNIVCTRRKLDVIQS